MQVQGARLRLAVGLFLLLAKAMSSLKFGAVAGCANMIVGKLVAGFYIEARSLLGVGEAFRM